MSCLIFPLQDARYDGSSIDSLCLSPSYPSVLMTPPMSPVVRERSEDDLKGCESEDDLTSSPVSWPKLGGLN